MIGKILKIVNKGGVFKSGIIESSEDKSEYYFSKDGLCIDFELYDIEIGVEISFDIEHTNSKYDKAVNIQIINNIQKKNDDTQFDIPGVSSKLVLRKAEIEHLKPYSKEIDVIRKLAWVLRITRIEHIELDSTSRYPFCLAGVTSIFKRFVRESGEVLIVFSHFDNEAWQEKTLKVESLIRKRREIVDRRPFVNFYILISNATELRDKIDSIKGEPNAAVIPFSFKEILSAKNKDDLSYCMLQRFDEYFFENNMLAENGAIDDDNLLFGDRGKIADSVVSRCHNLSNSGIFGLRRSGKTSVLNAVLRRLDREETPYILIESRVYETYRSWKKVLFDIACMIRARMLCLTREDGESINEFHSRLKLSSTEKDYEVRGVACFTEDVKSYLNDCLFIIAIDEIELITYNTATSKMWKSLEAYKGFWTALRECNCPLVVCGVNSTINEISTLSFNGEECDNPMYGRITNCTESAKTYLPSFTNEQTKKMINTLGQYSNIAFSNVYSQINHAFGGQPWAIRQFCSYIFERVKNKRNISEVYEVTMATYETLMREFKDSSFSINLCDTILQHLSIYKEEYKLLKKFAFNPSNQGLLTKNDSVLADHLQKYGLVEYDKTTGYVSFGIDILREHICKKSEKDPLDMSNSERRKYVQDKIVICERKLKKYIMNCYIYSKTPSEQKSLFITSNNKCILRPHLNVDFMKCSFIDFFDHTKFDFYFSTIKSIIVDNWNDLGRILEEQGITKSKFISCMEDLNAGRTDADHYDPENPTQLNKWDISNTTIDNFCYAFRIFNDFFEKQQL